jgi:hypothetical protein
VGRNRTGIDGFAGRCMTILPPRHRRQLKPRSPAGGPPGLQVAKRGSEASLRARKLRPWRAGYSIRLDGTEKPPERLGRGARQPGGPGPPLRIHSRGISSTRTAVAAGPPAPATSCQPRPGPFIRCDTKRYNSLVSAGRGPGTRIAPGPRMPGGDRVARCTRRGSQVRLDLQPRGAARVVRRNRPFGNRDGALLRS